MSESSNASSLSSPGPPECGSPPISRIRGTSSNVPTGVEVDVAAAERQVVVRLRQRRVRDVDERDALAKCKEPRDVVRRRCGSRPRRVRGRAPLRAAPRRRPGRRAGGDRARCARRRRSSPASSAIASASAKSAASCGAASLGPTGCTWTRRKPIASIAGRFARSARANVPGSPSWRTSISSTGSRPQSSKSAPSVLRVDPELVLDLARTVASDLHRVEAGRRCERELLRRRAPVAAGEAAEEPPQHPDVH